MAQIPDGPLLEGLKRTYGELRSVWCSWGGALVLRAVWGREPRTLRQYIQELARREQKAA
jgi:hypothetical protein